MLVPILAALGWWVTRDRGPEVTATAERPIVAVPPFENLGASDEEYFAAGITDEITSRLALIDGLGVISRTSARVYANSDKSTQEVARELGADYVLEGAIRWDKSRQPGRVRISPRLIRVQDDTYLWTDNYEREVTEIFSLQAMIASRIADALDVALLAPVREALDDRPTQSIEAYEAYLQGMKQLEAPGFGQESFEQGIEDFERAIAIDPDFALAHARLSSVHARFYHYGYDRSDARRAAARESAERALALKTNLAAARLALGYYYYWCAQDYGRALEELEIAQRIEPNNTRIWLAKAYVHRREGDLALAAELLEQVHALNPLDPNVETALGETYSTLRRYDQAEAPLRRAFALVPDDPYPHTELALVYLRWNADTTTARRVLDDLPAGTSGESSRVRMLVELFDRRFERAVELYPMSRDALAAPTQVVHLALIHALLGQKDAAVDELARALSIPSTISVAWVQGNPLWDGIRDATGYPEQVQE